MFGKRNLIVSGFIDDIFAGISEVRVVTEGKRT